MSPSLSPRRQRTREKRLEAIVAASLAIVAEESLEALTMTRVADAVDLTAGALYRYFSSKDRLLAELQARTIARVGAGLDADRAAWQRHLPTDARAAALAELVAAGAYYLELAHREPAMFRLVAMTLADPRPLIDDGVARELVAAPLAELIGRVCCLFETASAVGALTEGGNNGTRTIVYWTSLHGIATTAKLDRLTDDPGWFATEPLAREAMTALLVGWGAACTAVEAAHDWQRKRSKQP